MSILNKDFKKLLIHLKSNKIKIVGICLGHHLLFNTGDEGGSCDGLGLMHGEIKLLKKKKVSDILKENSIDKSLKVLDFVRYKVGEGV